MITPKHSTHDVDANDEKEQQHKLLIFIHHKEGRTFESHNNWLSTTYNYSVVTYKMRPARVSQGSMYSFVTTTELGTETLLPF